MSDSYRPGHYPSPEQTTRIPRVPHQAPRQAPRRSPEPGKNKTREYVLKGLGLVLVAVVSGMLWWLVQQGNSRPESSQDTGGTTTPKTKYEFVKHEEVPEPVRDSKCSTSSYNDTRKFFEKNPCTRLTRELYTATVDGRKVFTSVAVVRMPSAEKARELKELTERDNTGNVNDLVRENRVKVPGLKTLSGGGFASKIDGSDVVIVESDFDGGSKKEDEPKLDDICKDALAKGDEIKN